MNIIQGALEGVAGRTDSGCGSVYLFDNDLSIAPPTVPDNIPDSTKRRRWNRPQLKSQNIADTSAIPTKHAVAPKNAQNIIMPIFINFYAQCTHR